MIKMAQLEPIKKMHYLEGQSVREMRRRNGMGLNGVGIFPPNQIPTLVATMRWNN